LNLAEYLVKTNAGSWNAAEAGYSFISNKNLLYMKKIYPLVLLPLLFLVLAGCSKDFLKSYEDRIDHGTWELFDIDKKGIGSGDMTLPFTGGFFEFDPSGSLLYRDQAGNEYQGSWDMGTHTTSDCNTDADGNTDCSYNQVRTMSITVVNFRTQQVMTEFFEEIKFTDTNRFRAFIRRGLKTYVFFFKR
jgi:hypothetical protein